LEGGGIQDIVTKYPIGEEEGLKVAQKCHVFFECPLR